MKYKLIAFDMDGVIFKDTNLWLELHRMYGTFNQGVKLTKKYLDSDYERLVEEVVVKLWKGRDAKPYYDLINSLEYLPGVSETFTELKKKGYRIAIISASSIELARRVQKEFGVEHIFANELVIKDGKISGDFKWPVGAGKIRKAEIITNLCKKLKIRPKECVYVGDSENDIQAFQIVGLGIAFNSSSEELKRMARAVVDSNNLSDVLQFIP